MYARTTAVVATAAVGLLLSACSGSKPIADVKGTPVSATRGAASSPAVSKPFTAVQLFQKIAAAVPTAKLSGTVTGRTIRTT